MRRKCLCQLINKKGEKTRKNGRRRRRKYRFDIKISKKIQDKTTTKKPKKSHFHSAGF
jgi:hypothetical protein